MLLGRLDAGWCYYVEWNERGAFGEVLQDATREGLPSLAGRHDVSDVPDFLDFLRSGQTFSVGDFARYELMSPRIRAHYAALGFRSMVGAPLVKGGRLKATLLVGDTQPRAWPEGAVALVQEVAERTWAAVERARAEEALRESEEKYRTLFEAMDEGFALCELVRDADGRVVDYRYLDLNPALVRQGGIAPDVLRGQRATEAFPNLDPWLIDAYARVVESDESITVEHDFPHVGRWLRINAFPRGGDRFAVLFSDVSERMSAEAALRESEASLQRRVAEATTELRALSRRLLNVQEEERRALARELHDEVGQVLTGLALQLGEGSTSDARLEEALRIVADLTDQVRQLSIDLRPAALDRYGLLPALRSRLERYERQTGVRVDMRQEGVARRFPPEIEIAVYRIVQEALTNVARHAGVNSAEVRLFADDTALTASICDEGRGFRPGEGAGAGGLDGMRERAELLGGSLTVDAEPGGGVTITAELPLDAEPSGATA
jgi:signal transduction histidine kinase